MQCNFPDKILIPHRNMLAISIVKHTTKSTNHVAIARNFVLTFHTKFIAISLQSVTRCAYRLFSVTFRIQQFSQLAFISVSCSI